MIRKPKRDMTRPQAPHCRDWEIRWRSMWGLQRMEAKGLGVASAFNEFTKAMYGDAMPPGSPGKARGGMASLMPYTGPFMRVMRLR